MTTPVGGIIAHVYVDRGDVVAAGTLLADLDMQVEEADLELARARAFADAELQSRLAEAEFQARKLERYRELLRQDVISEAALDEVETAALVARLNADLVAQQLEIAALELARAEALLAERRIVAPLGGIVTEVAMTVGEYRDEQAHVVTIAQVDPLYVEVFVPMEFYEDISVGDRASVVLEVLAYEALTATVTVVDHVFDPASGTFGIRLELENPGNSLPAGLRCTLTFEGVEDAGPGASPASP